MKPTKKDAEDLDCDVVKFTTPDHRDGQNPGGRERKMAQRSLVIASECLNSDVIQPHAGAVPKAKRTLFSVSCGHPEKIENANPAAAELLRLCAFLDPPDEIPGLGKAPRNSGRCWRSSLQIHWRGMVLSPKS